MNFVSLVSGHHWQLTLSSWASISLACRAGVLFLTKAQRYINRSCHLESSCKTGRGWRKQENFFLPSPPPPLPLFWAINLSLEILFWLAQRRRLVPYHLHCKKRLLRRPQLSTIYFLQGVFIKTRGLLLPLLEPTILPWPGRVFNIMIVNKFLLRDGSLRFCINMVQHELIQHEWTFKIFPIFLVK